MNEEDMIPHPRARGSRDVVMWELPKQKVEASDDEVEVPYKQWRKVLDPERNERKTRKNQRIKNWR
jgi:hypothetical protein